MKLLHVLQAHPANCLCIEFDPSGKYFAVGSADALVSLWDVNELACIKTFSHLGSTSQINIPSPEYIQLISLFRNLRCEIKLIV